jgi:hypothetical protein
VLPALLMPVAGVWLAMLEAADKFRSRLSGDSASAAIEEAFTLRPGLAEPVERQTTRREPLTA